MTDWFDDPDLRTQAQALMSDPSTASRRAAIKANRDDDASVPSSVYIEDVDTLLAENEHVSRMVDELRAIAANYKASALTYRETVLELKADLRIANEAFLALLTECADLKRENERLRQNPLTAPKEWPGRPARFSSWCTGCHGCSECKP